MKNADIPLFYRDVSAIVIPGPINISHNRQSNNLLTDLLTTFIVGYMLTEQIAKSAY